MALGRFPKLPCDLLTLLLSRTPDFILVDCFARRLMVLVQGEAVPPCVNMT